MASNVAILDARDSRIRYAGAWEDAGVSEEFNGTTRWSAVQGSAASLTFVGTSITVFGTVAAIDPPQAPSMEFVIDNTVGTYTPAKNMTADVHHEALYTSPTMSNGTHTLVMTQSAAQAAGVMYLDYIMYNTTSTDVGQYFIDDRDPRIQYDPQWGMFGSDPDFQHTSQASSSAGASLTLPFEGRGISLYGGIINGSVLNASMVVDGGPPVFFVPSIQPAAVTTNNLIFNSGDLSSGKHTLVVTAENDQAVWVDYFLVTPPTQSAVSVSASTASPAVPSASTDPPSASHTGKTEATLIATIAGAAIGSLVLTLLAVLLWRRTKRRGRRQDSPLSAARMSTRTIIPFELVSSGASALRTPFSLTHAYSALPVSELASHLPQTMPTVSNGAGATRHSVYPPPPLPLKRAGEAATPARSGLPASASSAGLSRSGGASLSSSTPTDAPAVYTE
ncbi:hypothetical protein GGX14DRAFT_698435 [Mycena pura]|uniref:Transmembrane protein n=1 Tax=Mycena pura TaxID=153505 RepID=A0AAD6Y920_9AGAR|nr:hypothetical protein GGX14DRAFT_698435 [Mycena pura]